MSAPRFAGGGLLMFRSPFPPLVDGRSQVLLPAELPREKALYGAVLPAPFPRAPESYDFESYESYDFEELYDDGPLSLPRPLGGGGGEQSSRFGRALEASVGRLVAATVDLGAGRACHGGRTSRSLSLSLPLPPDLPLSLPLLPLPLLLESLPEPLPQPEEPQPSRPFSPLPLPFSRKGLGAGTSSGFGGSPFFCWKDPSSRTSNLTFTDSANFSESPFRIFTATPSSMLCRIADSSM
mmetsp:Transcript_5568/g.13747  ORF Transcript_5568/g.13747 Transcript_5568/m.13747 type:complete len:238 (-) Transcript_5568:893-1606(-)